MNKVVYFNHLKILFVAAALLASGVSCASSSSLSIPQVTTSSPHHHGRMVRLKVPQNRDPVIVGAAKKDNDVHKAHHTMSLSTLVINIVADLCPHGMLPLAYGIAKEGSTGVIPAILLLFAFGSMSGYTMTSFAELATETQTNSIGELWSKLFSPKTKWVAEMSVFSLCFGCCVFYSAFIGDIFGALATAAGFRGILAKRWVALATISLSCLLPLCLLEDLSALQFSSILGVCGIAFTFFTLATRFFDGSYAPGAAMTKLLSAKGQPAWPLKSKLSLFNVNKGTLILANMLCVAYLAHYNAINYYKELDNRSPKRYQHAVAAGFGIALSVFGGMMLMGYMIFGSAAQPLILNNFHRSKDLLATGARFATGLAITFAYPLMFAGLKSSMFSLMDSHASNKGQVSKGKQGNATVQPSTSKFAKNAAVVAALAAITSIAFKCGEEDVSVVLGIVGSVLGCGVAYIMPSVMRLQHMRNKKKAGLPIDSKAVALNHIIALMGAVFGVLGVIITLQSESHHH